MILESSARIAALRPAQADEIDGMAHSELVMMSPSMPCSWNVIDNLHSTRPHDKQELCRTMFSHCSAILGVVLAGLLRHATVRIGPCQTPWCELPDLCLPRMDAQSRMCGFVFRMCRRCWKHGGKQPPPPGLPIRSSQRCCITSSHQLRLVRSFRPWRSCLGSCCRSMLEHVQEACQDASRREKPRVKKDMLHAPLACKYYAAGVDVARLNATSTSGVVFTAMPRLRLVRRSAHKAS